MKKDTTNNRIIFDDDEDLFNFAVTPNYVVLTDENGNQYFGWNFTEDYTDTVAAQTLFLINDLKSRYLKNQNIDFKGITKPIALQGNFEQIFEDIDKEIESEECKSKCCAKYK